MQRIQTAVSWKTAPPFGFLGWRWSALMPIPLAKYVQPDLPPPRRAAVALRHVHDDVAVSPPSWIAVAFRRPSAASPMHQRPSVTLAPQRAGCLVNVELRNVRAGAATRRNGLSAVARSMTS